MGRGPGLFVILSHVRCCQRFLPREVSNHQSVKVSSVKVRTLMSCAPKRSDDACQEERADKRQFPCHNVNQGSVPRIHMSAHWRIPYSHDVTLSGKSQRSMVQSVDYGVCTTGPIVAFCVPSTPLPPQNRSWCLHNGCITAVLPLYASWQRGSTPRFVW